MAGLEPRQRQHSYLDHHHQTSSETHPYSFSKRIRNPLCRRNQQQQRKCNRCLLSGPPVYRPTGLFTTVSHVNVILKVPVLSLVLGKLMVAMFLYVILSSQYCSSVSPVLEPV